MATLLIHHPVFARHLVPFGHPERPERILAVEAVLAEPRFDALLRREARMCDVETVLLCHPLSHLEAMRHASPSEGLARIDADAVADGEHRGRRDVRSAAATPDQRGRYHENSDQRGKARSSACHG